MVSNVLQLVNLGQPAYQQWKPQPTTMGPPDRRSRYCISSDDPTLQDEAIVGRRGGFRALTWGGVVLTAYISLLPRAD